MTGIAAINAVYKQAHIVDQLAAKQIKADYLDGRIGPNVATARLRELLASANRQEVLA